MMDGIGRIEARIGQIETRIELGAIEGSAGAATFAQTLERATGAAPANGGGAGSPLLGADGQPLPPPPHWLGPMPVAPETESADATGVARWEDLIQKYAGESGVDAQLVRALMDQESGGNPRAVSSAGAMGLMQLMPETARGAGVTDAFDPDQNVRAGVALLKEHLDRYHGDVARTLAAYNAGPGAVARYGGVPPFRETQDYVRKITARLGTQSVPGE